MDFLDFLLYFLLAWATIYFLVSVVRHETSLKKLPPGPFPLPIFGNLLKLGSKPHISLTELSKIHGPVMSLQLGQITAVVISSAKVAKEALQKNDLFFSNRPVLDALCALNHHESSVICLPVSPPWRKLRKICNSQVFSVNRLNSSQGLRKKKVEDLLSHVHLSSQAGVPVDIGHAAFTTTLNLLSSTFFSVDLGDPSSEFAHEFKEIVRGIMEEAGKVNLADFFPVLKRIDPQCIRRRMGVLFGKMMNLFNNMIDQRLQGKRPSGFIQGSDVLDALLGINQEKTEEIEKSDIPHLLVDLFTAGTDTTSSTLEWAMAELIHNPDKLKKAQEELDDVIGNGNPVEEQDIARLPYLLAIVKETFRLHPPAPFLVPRKVDKDVELCGFTVPKNAQVFVNVWAIGRDPTLWDNPNSFEPERFLGSETDVKGHDFELIPFGSGRRICPGLPLAIRMLHLMLGSLIHGFNWKLGGEVAFKELDMQEKFGFTLEKAQRLCAIPIRR